MAPIKKIYKKNSKSGGKTSGGKASGGKASGGKASGGKASDKKTKTNKNNNVKKKENNKNRYFTLVDFPEVGKTTGKFSGKYPSNAVYKFLTKLSIMVDLKNTNDRNFIFFTIRDIDSNKEYSYIGTRVELVKPVKLENGRTINYRNIMTRVNKDNMSIYDLAVGKDGKITKSLNNSNSVYGSNNRSNKIK